MAKQFQGASTMVLILLKSAPPLFRGAALGLAIALVIYLYVLVLPLSFSQKRPHVCFLDLRLFFLQIKKRFAWRLRRLREYARALRNLGRMHCPSTWSSVGFQLAASRSKARGARGAASSRNPRDDPGLHRQQALSLQFLARKLAGRGEWLPSSLGLSFRRVSRNGCEA